MRVATLGNLFATALNGSQIGGVIGFQDVTEDVIGESTQFLRPTYQRERRLHAAVAAVSARTPPVVGVFAYRRHGAGGVRRARRGRERSRSREKWPTACR